MMRVGTLVGERYELARPIAVGGMGAVWAATDTVLGRAVAVKLLKPEYSGDRDFLDRFRAEARHTARLSHPNIAAVYDYGETIDGPAGPAGQDSGVTSPTTAYLVMELVAGEPLSASLAGGRVLPAERVLSILEQAGAGLAAAHAVGLVHRDVKPGNLLTTSDDRIKITDFGIARAVDAVPVTATGTVLGTARYISPEQAAGEPVSPASDLYSLGVVGYEALAGRPPFEADTPVAQAIAHVHDDPLPLPPSVPGPVRSLISRMMAKDPADRPADGAALAPLIAAVRRGESVDLPPAEPSERADNSDDDPTVALAVPVRGPLAPPAQPADEAYLATGATTEAQSAAAVPGQARPPRRRRTMTGPLLTLILLVLFVAIGTALANGVFSGDPSPTTVTRTETAPPETTTRVTTVTRTTSVTVSPVAPEPTGSIPSVPVSSTDPVPTLPNGSDPGTGNGTPDTTTADTTGTEPGDQAAAPTEATPEPVALPTHPPSTIEGRD